MELLSSNCLLVERHLDTIFEYRDIITKFRPSIDAASKEVYERIRVGGKWEDLHRNLHLFAERNAAAAWPSSRHGRIRYRPAAHPRSHGGAAQSNDEVLEHSIALALA